MDVICTGAMVGWCSILWKGVLRGSWKLGFWDYLKTVLQTIWAHILWKLGTIYLLPGQGLKLILWEPFPPGSILKLMITDLSWNLPSLDNSLILWWAVIWVRTSWSENIQEEVAEDVKVEGWGHNLKWEDLARWRAKSQPRMTREQMNRELLTNLRSERKYSKCGGRIRLSRRNEETFLWKQ